MDTLKQRSLTEKEEAALKEHLLIDIIDENKNLAVVFLDSFARPGEYIVNIPDDGNWPKEKNEWGNIIVCQLLWLARRDENIANENTTYDEFEYPDKIHIAGDEDGFIKNHLTKLRDETTDMSDYREHSDAVSKRLLMMATRNVSMVNEAITTGTGVKMKAPRIEEKVITVEIPRASRPMSNAAKDLLPQSKVGVVLLQRDEDDPESKPKFYYSKLPEINSESVIIIVDPMLATGGSMDKVIEELIKHEPKEIRVVCQIASPEGIRRLQAKYPDVEIWVGELDSHLNKENYIIPGLGDAGDRYFGT